MCVCISCTVSAKCNSELVLLLVDDDDHHHGGGGGGDFRCQPIWVKIATSECAKCHCMKVVVAYILDIL